ncbi:hypothetical protein KRR38_34095 [Novosphingobium sp. G106]|nr:hypothetical protein [Novosphingobium sp. G106]MBV1692531.1 hypothetical protein [Novosphingobium sp. G106]
MTIFVKISYFSAIIVKIFHGVDLPRDFRSSSATGREPTVIVAAAK